MKCKITCGEIYDTPDEPCLLTPMSIFHFGTGILTFVIPLLFFSVRNKNKYTYSILISAFLIFVYEFKDIVSSYDVGVFTKWVRDVNMWWYKVSGSGNIQGVGSENSWQNSVFDAVLGMSGTFAAYFIISRYDSYNKLCVFLISVYAMWYFYFIQRTIF